MKGKASPSKGVKYDDKAPTEIYAGAGSKVAHEAKSSTEGFKRGGRTARKHGGKAEKHDMHIAGEKSKHHAHRKPRKSGGQVMSSAHSGEERKAH